MYVQLVAKHRLDRSLGPETPAIKGNQDPPLTHSQSFSTSALCLLGGCKPAHWPLCNGAVCSWTSYNECAHRTEAF